jgi:hypothetical protein
METEQVNDFLYLGSIIICDERAIEEDVKSRVRTRNRAFVQM